jgi:hypothetical protein
MCVVGKMNADVTELDGLAKRRVVARMVSLHNCGVGVMVDGSSSR